MSAKTNDSHHLAHGADNDACGTQQPIDISRRKFLTRATTVLGGIGLCYTAFPFLASWQPSQRALAAGAPVEADISKLQPGEQVVFAWRSKPIFILRRTPDMLAELTQVTDFLRDPLSQYSEQPAYAKNIYRSIRQEFFVAIGICTHLGCTPLLKPEKGSVSPGWQGGYFCPCHGSTYDFAGRVFKNVPAPLNLAIPPYQYLSDTMVLIGVEST